MDLRYSEEYEGFRAEVKAFLADNWPPKGEESQRSQDEQQARFRGLAIERGYLARAIPREYGGSEQPPDVLRGAIIREEFGRAGAPQDPHPPTAQLIPTLLEHGTEALKQRYLPPTLRGDLVWCQGYSEPGSGSDLASVQTRAERVGDEWVINGQKIWTTGAHQADMIYLLCRTEPDAGKHAGISYLLLDMNQPGVDVRPLKQMSGDAHFNEVFFDDARTPADHIVGKRGEGWIVSRSTLQHERNAAGRVAEVRGPFEELVRLAQKSVRNGGPAIADPNVRQRVAEIEGYVASHEYSAYRQLTCDARGESPGPVATMNKLAKTDVCLMMAKLAFDLLGDEGLSAPVSSRDGPPTDSRTWIYEYMNSIAQTIGAGTSNIQRNIIGERGLGLPRDFAAQKNR